MDRLHPALESEIDKKLIVDVILRSLEVCNAEEFMDLIRGPVNALMPHDCMTCGIVSGGPKFAAGFIHKYLHHNYPMGYFLDLRNPDGSIETPLQREWRQTREPVLFQAGRDDAKYDAKFVKNFKKYDLHNTIGHGVLDVQGSVSTYFVFSRMPGEVGQRHVFLIKLLTPNLHQALTRALATVSDFGEYTQGIRELLSERQKQILTWLHEGKTNWEISRILGLTEKNVKYHIEQILAKLDVRNRTQAVAKASNLGLI